MSQAVPLKESVYLLEPSATIKARPGVRKASQPAHCVIIVNISE